MYEILTNRSIVEIKGKDSISFFQNLITNDLNLSADYLYSYMLNAAGKYLFDFFISKISNDRLLIDIHNENVSNFINKLNIFKLRAALEITHLKELRVLCYKNEQIMNALFERQDPRFNILGARAVVPIDSLSLLNNDNIQNNLYIEGKYNFCIPDGGTDLVYEKSYIMEFGCNELNGVSYNKGCYLGQEVVSRTHYQGVIRKKIYKIICEDNIGELNNYEITNEQGEKIGICTSGYGKLGIALLKLEAEHSLENLTLLLDNKEIQVSIPLWRK